MIELFTVADRFQIAGRGCVLVPGLSAEAGSPVVRVGARIRLRTPDGRIIDSHVCGIEMINYLRTPEQRTAPVLLPAALSRDDVPVGTRVFLVESEVPVSTVAHIFIAAAHGEPMRSVQSVHAIPGQGLSGDRYAVGQKRKGPDRDVTLIELENIEAFRAATGHDLSVDGPRRNIVTTGIRLNDLCGRQFRIGSVLALGVELCEPCKLFQKRTYAEVLPFFVGKGGLRAKIVSAGDIGVGDEIHDAPE